MDRSADLDGFLSAAVAALGNHKRHDLGVWLALAVDAFQTGQPIPSPSSVRQQPIPGGAAKAKTA